MVRWLHISDLHIGENADWNNFKSELLQKCREYDKIDLVIVTGDFHNFSEHDDFHLAASFLRDLLGSLGLDIEQDLFVVPGNHDGVSDVKAKNIYISAAKYKPFDDTTQWVQTLLMAFQGYETFVKELIPHYPEDHPATVHSRVWRNKINFIHCNTALAADGEEKINQLLDVNTLSKISCETDMPNIILAHNHFSDLHEKHQLRVKDAIRAKSICAYFCGDRHTQGVDKIPLDKREAPCIVSYKGAPDPKDSHSAFGVIFGEWEDEWAELKGWRWESGQGFNKDQKITGKRFLMRAESVPPPAVPLCEPAIEEPPQKIDTGKESADAQIKEYVLKKCFVPDYYKLTSRQLAQFNRKHEDIRLSAGMNAVELNEYVETAQERGVLEELVQDMDLILTGE